MKKKKRNSGRSVVGGNGGSFAAGGTTGPVVPVAAKVEVPKSREPGDETYDLAPDELSNGEIITAGDVIKNPIQEIDLGLFETNLDEVVGELNKLRDKMFDQARENSLSARNYSTVLDQLEVIRQIGGQSFGSV